MKIEWTEKAVRDLDEAVGYVAEHDQDAAERMLTAIFVGVELLEENPELGQVVMDLEPAGRFRHVVRGKHRIIYEVSNDLICVMRVWDARRDPGTFEAG
jgi:plasmid stabilization system protein ParE